MLGEGYPGAAAIRQLPIAPETKGFGGPLHRSPTTAAELSATKPHAGAGWLSSPRAVVRESALRHNIETMARYCRDQGVALHPHGKTTMSPQVVAAQLEAGACGVTVATVAQLRTFHARGLGPVLVANQVVDEASVLWLGRELSKDPAFEPVCYVDSVEGVALLDHLISSAPDIGGVRTGRSLRVLVELGHSGGRTGARSIAEAHLVAEAAASAPALTLAGVAGYEGSIARETASETLTAAREFCLQLGTLTGELLDRGLLTGRPMISAGGSAYFDAVVDALAGESSWSVVLRSGCYVTHDHGLYHRLSPFERATTGYTLRPALQVFAPVLSRPDRETVVIGAGRRDVSSDRSLPLVLAVSRNGHSVRAEGAESRRLYDQHLVVSVPQSCDWRAGDEVELGISHPCTTFDKWQWLPVVDDDERIVDVLGTFF